jgi:prepilin-type N-terminal cleavage/methylation domain-containing protein
VWHRFATGGCGSSAPSAREYDRRRRTFARAGARCPGAAFSLIELVTVVVVIAVLATIAAPRFSNVLAGNRATQAANRIALDLALAQQRARATSASQTVTFNAVSHKYTLTGMPDPDRPAVDYVVELSREPYAASIVTVEFKASSELAGDPNVIFDAYGKPDSGGSVKINVGGHVKTVTVDAATGKATIS